jgi:hypothetical protein
MSTAGRGIVYGEIDNPTDSIDLATWLDQHFDAEQKGDEAVSGLMSDFDLDGRPTLIEWVTATDPTRFDPMPAFRFEPGEGRPSLTLTTQAELVSARLEIQVSEDMVNWRPVQGEFESLSAGVDRDGKIRTTRYLLQPTVLAKGPIFFRLAANLN